MRLQEDYLNQINKDIATMETTSVMGLNELSYNRYIKVKYVYSVISEMFILTMITLFITLIGMMIY
ncbi:hypothetical protein ACED96_11910 [Clostridium thermobutyricum]|uniref:Uncharacterized protein n=2 Tax=Clostridium thermobutyricum TaxID=29372 RepID=N9XVD7_9CLOT|nr:hypothetical protein [Clostridium thermobutyricum]ENY99908.1 hypothetical protein HMPREF1092_03045 [Clostridium thermobutyricum]OPX49767.1 hypothetical protein CLTHE_04980 [Clostridium thermobutyricum DSM 4928]